MSEEYFDVLNEDGKPSGVIRRRKSCHSLGLLHRVAHVWLMNSKREVLVQKRSMLKDAFPGAWDVSSGGHVDAGEKCEDAARRELIEELGISELLEYTSIDFLFEMRVSYISDDKKFVDNKFISEYGVWVNEDAMKNHLHFKLQETEVDEVRWVPVKELRQKYLDNDPNYAWSSSINEVNLLFDSFESYMDKKLKEEA